MNTSQNLKRNETNYVCSFSIVLYQYCQETRTKTKAVMRCINDRTSSAEISKCAHTQGGNCLGLCNLAIPSNGKVIQSLMCESVVKNHLFIDINCGYF